MNLDTLNKWLTLLANIGVIAGIIFLIIEINQNSLETRLQTESSFQSTFTTVELAAMTDKELLDALLRSQKGELLTDADQLRVLLFYRAVVRGYQNSYYQALSGVLNPQIWEGEKHQMAQSFGFDQGLVSYWRSNQSLYTAEFNLLVTSMIDESK